MKSTFMPSCGCTESTMTHPILTGFAMGGAIYALDMMLRPQFAANAGMEIILFLIEGAACDVVYGMLSISGHNFKSAFGNISLMKSLLAGTTIWISDMFLGVQTFGGLGSEMIKFFLQGFLVYFVLGYGA